MGVLKIISNGYVHEDDLEGIINPKCQLSIISGWRDIANFKMCKIQTKILQNRIWIWYIFLDFYATEPKLSEIEEWTVNFVMNRKKLFFGCQTFELISWMRLFQSTILPRFRVNFPKIAWFFLQKQYTVVKLHFSTYQIWKNIMGHTDTEKINLWVALFLECNVALRYAYSYFIWNDIVSNLYHMYLAHMYLSLLKT